MDNGWDMGQSSFKNFYLKGKVTKCEGKTDTEVVLGRKGEGGRESIHWITHPTNGHSSQIGTDKIRGHNSSHHSHW